MAAAPAGHEEEARRDECRWQRDRLPDEVRDPVLEDQRRRNAICWDVFDVPARPGLGVGLGTTEADAPAQRSAQVRGRPGAGRR